MFVCADLLVSKFQKLTQCMWLCIYSTAFCFYHQSKNRVQDFVDVAIVSVVLPQDSEAVEKKFKTKMFCCLSPQNPFMCDKENRKSIFPKSWYDQEFPTSHEKVGAGFYCTGCGNRVCFFIVAHNYLTGNCVTIPGRSMQRGFLCVNFF